MAKVFKGSLLQLASEGRLTLQIPELALMPDPTTPAPEMEDVPDDWVYNADWEGIPTAGRHSLLMYTKAGYLANAEALQGAYANGIRRRTQNPNSDIDKAKKDFHDYAMTFYAKVKKTLLLAWVKAINKSNRLKATYDSFPG